MDKIKVKILSEQSIESLEHSVGWWINELQEQNHVIIDIKFGGCGGNQNRAWIGYYEYSAMVIYK